MRIAILLVALVGVVIVAVALAVRATRSTRRREQPEVTHLDADEFPEPGGPSPRKGGRPVPGSRDDRREHGKP